MRGQITFQILKIIGAATLTAADLCNAILSSGYGASVSKIQRNLHMQTRKRTSYDIYGANEKHRYIMMLRYLREEKLIEEKHIGHTKLLTLTRKGRQKLTTLIASRRRHVPLPKIDYQNQSSPTFTIIAFDVPEKERRKRDWLRSVLEQMHFTAIQRSVWIGKIKIPEQFLNDLSELHMLAFVEIFEISKTGTLKHFNMK